MNDDEALRVFKGCADAAKTWLAVREAMYAGPTLRVILNALKAKRGLTLRDISARLKVPWSSLNNVSWCRQPPSPLRVMGLAKLMEETNDG